MKRYRIVDSWWEPYHSSYNSTDLLDVAESISQLADWDWALEDDPAYSTDNLYQALLNGERDFIFIVEEQDEPFANHWYDEEDDEEIFDETWEVVKYIMRNYSSSAINIYARNVGVSEWDLNKLVDFVRNYPRERWDNIVALSKIVDDFIVRNALSNWNKYKYVW